MLLWHMGPAVGQAGSTQHLGWGGSSKDGLGEGAGEECASPGGGGGELATGVPLEGVVVLESLGLLCPRLGHSPFAPRAAWCPLWGMLPSE